METKIDQQHPQERQINLTGLEKAVLAVFGGIVISLLSWTTVTTNNTATSVAVMKTSIEYIKRDAQEAGRDRFTGVQGDELERRIENLEKLHQRAQ